MDKFVKKYRIPPARLQDWDYHSPGLYLVTICTKNMESYFGRIMQAEAQDLTGKRHFTPLQDAALQPTPIANTAKQNWEELPVGFSFVELDEFVIMPNHIHGILLLKRHYPGQRDENKSRPQSQKLASIIRGYKTSVRKHATMNEIDFAWQTGFYEHIIRSKEELNRIRQYIIDNPSRWQTDKDNSENLMM